MCRLFENKTTPSPPPFNIQDPEPPPQYSTLPPSSSSAAAGVAAALVGLEAIRAFIEANPQAIPVELAAGLTALKAAVLALPGPNPPPPPPSSPPRS